MSSCEATRAPQPPWRKASFCQSGECIEVARYNGVILMRDSKCSCGGLLRYTAEEWKSFVSGIKAGEFDDLG
jgi:Domain of unknown function (DUF397)